MNSHKDARLTVRGRALLVKRILEEGLRSQDAAQAMGVSARTAYKWLARFRAEGAPGLESRSSRARHCPHASSASHQRRFIELRRERCIYRHISQEVGGSPSTVARVLRRAGLNRLSALEPVAPSNRYEHEAAGDLLHLDIKKLARFRKPGHRATGDRQKGKSYGAGYERVQVAIDDHSRLGWTGVWPNESAASAWRALLAALRYYRPSASRSSRC